MIVFTSRDNRFTQFVERNGHRLAGATICHIRGHRPMKHLWGACDRCCQFYWKPPPRRWTPTTPETMGAMAEARADRALEVGKAWDGVGLGASAFIGLGMLPLIFGGLAAVAGGWWWLIGGPLLAWVSLAAYVLIAEPLWRVWRTRRGADIGRGQEVFAAPAGPSEPDAAEAAGDADS